VGTFSQVRAIIADEGGVDKGRVNVLSGASREATARVSGEIQHDGRPFSEELQ
jgi:hypothetical protein